MAKLRMVVGIDVGGTKKGFHAVALKNGKYLDKYPSQDPKAIATWCKDIGAQVVAIDAPCRWGTKGTAKPSELELARVGIHCYATPDKKTAKGREFNHWMINGAKLYKRIEKNFPILKSKSKAKGKVCFETFPQAVACHLAGKIVSAKQKRTVRRGLLLKAGVDIAELTNIDWKDAALCALTADRYLQRKCEFYGEANQGYIVVPRCKRHG